MDESILGDDWRLRRTITKLLLLPLANTVHESVLHKSIAD